MKVTRQEFDTKPLADLASEHTRAEIIAALESFGCKPPSDGGRTMNNAGGHIAIWVAVEQRCMQMEKRSELAACRLVADDMKGLEKWKKGLGPGDVTINKPPGAARIRQIHGEAKNMRKSDPVFNKRLDQELAKQCGTLKPGDTLIPLVFVGGPELTAFVVRSDTWAPGSIDIEDPLIAVGLTYRAES
jgi:hypothetical protein